MNRFAMPQRPALFSRLRIAGFFAIGLAAFLLPHHAAVQGFGGAFAGFSSDSEEPIQIEADRLEVYDQKAEAIFQGNVKVVQGVTVLTTGNLQVFYEKSESGGSTTQSTIERLIVTGGVHVRSDDQIATADEGSYNMKTEDVVLKGDVTLTQGANIAKGCLFKANLKTGIAHLESKNCAGPAVKKGRVQMLLTPGSSRKPQDG